MSESELENATKVLNGGGLVDIELKDAKPRELRTFDESMSNEIGELAGALAVAQGAMSNGAKDKQGYGYKYMTLASLLDISRGPLSANGIWKISQIK